ncbi:MAG: TetR family transcriptional regulator [Deltaproteobacteria bacterium]|nr:TetR family transcriptional regulator [Deltaproteobacteria bacterium]
MSTNNEISGKRKEKILEAALLCFNEKGYHKTSIDDIALNGKISKGGIYYHFKSKDELFLKLFNFRLNRYTEQLKAYIQEESDPVKRIRILVQKWGLILKENEDFFKFCMEFSSMGAREKEIRKEMTSFYRSSVEIFRQIIEEGVATGEFENVDTERIARLIYFLSQGVFSTFFAVDCDFDLIEQHTFNMETILKSINESTGVQGK